MKLVSVLLSLFVVLTLGNGQDSYIDQHGGVDTKNDAYWPVGIIPNEENKKTEPHHRLLRTPCRRHNNPSETPTHLEKWVPSFTSKFVKPIMSYNDMKPESLKNTKDLSEHPENSTMKNINNELDNKYTETRIKCYKISLPRNVPNNPLVTTTVQSTDSTTTTHLRNTGIFRRRMQYNDPYFNEREKTNNELVKICSELNLSAEIPNLDSALRRNFNNQEGNPENKRDPSIEKGLEDEKDKEQTISYQNSIEKYKNLNLKSLLRTNNIQDNNLNYNKNSGYNKANEYALSESRSGGVHNLGQSRIMLMESSRVCYACNTASDPTCWKPSRRTTVKYCSKDHDSCVTKKFSDGDLTTIIRDCAKSCNDIKLPNLQPKYKSCSMCHLDLCNGAYSINSHKTITMGFVFFYIVQKIQSSL